MGDAGAAALIAVGGVDEPQPTARTGANDDFGAIGIAITARIVGMFGAGQHRLDRQPMPGCFRHVAQQFCRPGNRGDQQIDLAVAVDVAPAQAAADIRRAAKRRVCLRNVLKHAVPLVAKQLVAFGVLAPVRTELGIFNIVLAPGDVTIDKGEVEQAVEIEIGEHRAEAGTVPR